MATIYTYTSGGSNYYGSDADRWANQRYTEGDRGGAWVGGYSHDEDYLGNRKALIMFNYSGIRSALVGQRVTGCYLNFYVKDLIGNSGLPIFGTHNYTSIPSSWSNSRVNLYRVTPPNYVGVGQVNNLSLGTVIGTEFKDGVTTGLTLGPGPTNSENYFAEISQENTGTRSPVLIINYEAANQAPREPQLVAPASGAILDIETLGVDFRWNHIDPDNDPMSAFRFQRRKPNTSGGFTVEWWNGTAFTSSASDLSPSLLVGGALTFDPETWANDTTYEWTVATKDPSGLLGPYAPYRSLYGSTPPVTTVIEPTAKARVPRPNVRWTFSDADGDSQYAWAIQIVEPAVYNDSGWNPDNFVGQVWSGSSTRPTQNSPGTYAATSIPVGVDLRNHKTYRAYVRTASTPYEPGGVQWSAPWSFSTFEVVVPPSAPTLLYPNNGSVADLGSGFTMEWRNSYFSNVGSQTAFCIRRQVDGTASFEYWNGTEWGGLVAGDDLPFLPGASSAYTFRAGEVPNAHTYVLSVAIRDDYNEVSPWSSGSSVLASSAATVSVIAPTEIANVTNPVVSWTTYDLENDPQQSWQVRVIHSSVYGGTGSGFDPGTATAVWDSGEKFEETTRSVELPVDLDNAQVYRAYVRVATGGIYSGWSFSEFTVSIVPPSPPTATTIVRLDDGAIDIVIQGRDSMLSEDAARGVDGWQEYDGSNSTVANGVQFGSSESTYAVSVTSIAEGTMVANTVDVWPVTPGMTYTAAATLLADLDSTPVNAYVSLDWIDASSSYLPPNSATPISDETAVRSIITARAPSEAAYAGIRVTFQSVPEANQVHTFFDPVLRPTTGDEWSSGGTLGETFASVSEVTENRQIRYGQNVPIPVADQRVTIRDEEARMGVDMVYAVTIRAIYANAALVSPPVTLPPARWTSGYLWLSDPLRRHSGRFFHPQSFDAVTRPVRQGKFRPIGRPDAIITTGVRGLREGSFTLVTHTREEREEFTALSDESEILLLRIPPDNADPAIADPIGETLYVKFVDDAPETRPLQQRTPHREITQSWVEQRSPAVRFAWETDEEEG